MATLSIVPYICFLNFITNITVHVWLLSSVLLRHLWLLSCCTHQDSLLTSFMTPFSATPSCCGCWDYRHVNTTPGFSCEFWGLYSDFQGCVTGLLPVKCQVMCTFKDQLSAVNGS